MALRCSARLRVPARRHRLGATRHAAWPWTSGWRCQALCALLLKRYLDDICQRPVLPGDASTSLSRGPSVLGEVLQPHLATGDEPGLFVGDFHLPQLLAAATMDRDACRRQGAVANRT